MNIFVLDTSPMRAAEAHCDKHVVKMIVETAQILSTTLFWHDEVDDFYARHGILPYKAAYANHPCTKWAASAPENAAWLTELGCCLLMEYQYRYPHKTHATYDLMYAFRKWFDVENFRVLPKTFVLAMPEEYWPFEFPVTPEKAVKAYRMYYALEKRHLLHYTKRIPPAWLSKYNIIK